MGDEHRTIRLLDGDLAAWVEQETSIHLKAITIHGDPVELTFEQALALAIRLRRLVLTAVADEAGRQLETAGPVSIPTPSELTALSSQNRYRALAVLSDALTDRLRAAESFDGFAASLIAQLKEAGFELYSFDFDDGWQVWCGDWTRPEASCPLIVSLDDEWGVELSWSRSQGKVDSASEVPSNGA